MMYIPEDRSITVLSFDLSNAEGSCLMTLLACSDRGQTAVRGLLITLSAFDHGLRANLRANPYLFRRPFCSAHSNAAEPSPER